jgi:hypothetical protein
MRTQLATCMVVCLLTAVGVLAVAAEHTDYAIGLGGGYQLVRANEHEVFISDAQQHVVVPGRITKYAMSGSIVVGFVRVPDWPDQKSNGLFPDVVEGYFLLNTETNARSSGLTLEQLKSELQRYGVTDVPAMKVPCRSS